VDAGADAGRVVTPATLAVRLAALPGAAPATETVAGIAELATQVETDAGLDDARIVTPLKLATTLVPLTDRVSTAEGDIVALDSRLDTAEASIVVLQDRVLTTESNIGGLDARLTTAEGGITNLQAADVALDGRLDAVEAKNTQQDGRLDTAENNLTAVINSLQDHETRIDTAEASIVTLQGKTNPATETTAGIVELATQTEVNAGADAGRVVTPATLAVRLAAMPGAAPATETVAGIAEIATDAEVTAGADDTRIVSPKKLETRINARLAGYVLKVGDTMTGPLTLSGVELRFSSAGVVRASSSWEAANSRWYVNINDAAGAFAWTAFSVTSGGFGLGTVPGHRFHVYNSGFVQAHIQCGNTDQARQGYSNSQRYWVSGVMGSEYQIWDLTAGWKTLAIDVNGKLWVTHGGLNLTGDLIMYGYNIGCGDVYATGALRNGPGDAGRLRCWNTANQVCFRWNNGLFYRVDEAVDAQILTTSTGASGFRVVSGQPGPTGIGAFVDQAGTAYGWYCDMVSDPSMKLDMSPSLVSALDRLAKVDCIRYRWNPDKSPWNTACELGFSAAQLREVIPEMVGMGDDGLLRLNLKQGVPWLVKAVQELAARVTELERMQHGH
jgi:hypothetical protein